MLRKLYNGFAAKKYTFVRKYETRDKTISGADYTGKFFCRNIGGDHNFDAAYFFFEWK